ncbi:MAG: acyl--CoA ligase [Pirellulales bacterium]|nr:acyl--CoA ligase [Pirellulales bacterium]
MSVATLASVLSPGPILAACAAFRGSIIDLDAGRVVGPAALGRGREHLARELTQCGVQPGERIVVAVANGPAFFAVLGAALEIGAAPLLVHVKTPAVELRRTALRFGAPWVLTDEASDTELDDAQLPARQLAADGTWHTRLARVSPQDPAFELRFPALPAVPLHPTSGTTGVPKVAVRPGACAIAEAAHYVETIGIGPHDVILATTPMSHAYAYGMGVMVPLISHAKVVTMRSFDAAIARRALLEQGITILPAVPAMLDVLTFGAGNSLRGTARCVLSAGAPLPERTARRFFECAGVHVRPLYGTTETGGISVGTADFGLAGDGYVGPSMRGVDAEIRAAGAMSNSREDIGRVAIRSSSMMAGYLAYDGIDMAAIADGWFVTGDIGMRDERGGLHLHGRESEVINVGGLKVIPVEVEEVLAALPGVMDVKVYAGQDRNGRQFVKAALVTDPQVDEARVRAYCDAELVYYKRPRTVVLTDRLPRTPSGKIIAAQLP